MGIMDHSGRIGIPNLANWNEGDAMKRRCSYLLVMGFALAIPCMAQPQQAVNPADARVIKEVRHELLMLPYFGVFDYIAFKVEGDTVTLLGTVVLPRLMQDVAN